MLVVLCGSDLDGEVDRIPSSLEQLQWRRRRLDAPRALAAILLPVVLDDLEAAADDGDFFRLLELTLPRL